VVIEKDDLRLIAALQCDGRVTTEHAARVLEMNPRVVQRRLRSLLGNGLRVVAVRPHQQVSNAMLLRVRVLRGKLDAITAALAAREDIPFVDVSIGGDEILAVLVGDGNRLVFRQLPATSAVTSVETYTIMHVYSTASDWHLDALTDVERHALEPRNPYVERELADVDQKIIGALEEDLRLPAAAIASRIGQPESTVRRRLAVLREDGQFRTQAFIDPKHLGLSIDANLFLRINPGLLDKAGRLLATHPAVHGSFATTGTSNLHVAVWLRDLEHLYQFITHDIAQLGVTDVETVLIGHAVKRPGR
jgi:DNA-binding Lrp family transcriptional regulator